MGHPYIALLKDRPVRLLWAGMAFSAMGSELYRVGAIWLAAELAGPKASLMVTAQSAASLTVSLLAGPLIEMLPRRRFLITADLVQAAASLAVVAVALAAGLTFPVLIIASVILTVFGISAQPVFLSSLPAVAPEGRLRETNGLFDSATRIAQSVGPFLAAAAMSVVPAVHLLTANALSFLASAGAIAVAGQRIDHAAQVRHDGNWRRALSRGVHAANRIAGIRSVLASTAIRGGCYALGYMVAVPVLFAGQPGGGGLGAVALVFGAGAAVEVIATPLLVLTRPARPLARLFDGYVLIGVGVAAVGLAAHLASGWQVAAMSAGAMIIGLGNSMATLQITTFFASRLPGDDYAAVLRLRGVTIISSIMIGTAAGPWVLSALNPAMTTVACGLVATVAGMAGRLARPARTLGPDFRDPAEAHARGGEEPAKLAS
jgi:hypothetical protein